MKKTLIACAGLLALSAASVTTITPVKADVVYPWCQELNADDIKSCGFASLAQCQGALGTQAGICTPNPRHYAARMSGQDAYAYSPASPNIGAAALGAGVGAVVGGPVGAVIGGSVGATAIR